MKFDKLSVVVGAAILIVIAAYIVLQFVKSLPPGTKGPLVGGNHVNVSTTPATLPNSGSGPTNNSANITVNSPSTNQTVSAPFDVTGSARVFENTLNYRVKDSSGNPIIEGSAIAQAPDTGQFGNYTFTISGISQKGKVTLEVFDYSAKDGSEIDKLIVPLILK